MSKTRIIVSVVVLVVSLAAAGFVGATVFSAAASTTAEKLSETTTWSTDDDKPKGEDENKKGTESQLKTWDHEGECAEITEPVAIEKVTPSGYGTWHTDRVTGVVWHLRVAESDQLVDGGCLGGSTRTIQGRDLLGLGVPVERKAVSPDADGNGLNHV